MKLEMVPFNIGLLILTKEDLATVRPVTAMDVFIGSTRNFHPDGLFSTEIFGMVGDERRCRRLSYINLKIKVFHPLIYKTLCKVKKVYGEIMAGASYAIWDDQAKDFIKSTPGEGDTGFDFFVSHFNELVFEERKSTKREFAIALINKHRDNCLIDKITVMPAGLRDYEINEAGKPTKDEINTFYMTLLGRANLVSDIAIRTNIESLDRLRYSIQETVCEIYDYVANMLEGKKKLILGRWAARRIFNGTRNVITSLNNSVDTLDSPLTVGYNQTVVGLYQFMKATLPVVIHKLRSGFLSKVFIGHNSPAILVNPKTLKKEMVHIDPMYYDEWMTDEGLEKVITHFGIEDIRHDPIDVMSRHIGLIYKGPDGTYKLFQDIDDLPKNLSKDNVTPITFAELLYLSIFENANETPCFFTRYPITGYGSIYPSMVYLKTTVRSEIREELGDDWVSKTGLKALQFPIPGMQFVNSMSPSVSHIKRLTADYDR